MFDYVSSEFTFRYYGDFNSLCFSRFHAVHIANKNALSENILPDCVQVTLAVSRLIDCSASAAAS